MPQLNDPKRGIIDWKINWERETGNYFSLPWHISFSSPKKKRKRKKKAYFFEFESRIFHNIGPFKCVLHRKVNSHDKINLIIYFGNLIIELNILYVVTIYVKFHLNRRLITFQSINVRQNECIRLGLGIVNWFV